MGLIAGIITGILIMFIVVRILPVVRRRCPDCGAHRHWLSGRCTNFHCTQYWTSR